MIHFVPTDHQQHRQDPGGHPEEGCGLGEGPGGLQCSASRGRSAGDKPAEGYLAKGDEEEAVVE